MTVFGNQDPKVTIHGWRGTGPLVDVEEYQPGFKNRRQRWLKTIEHKPARGRDLQKPAHQIVHRVDDPGYDVVAFNKGHAYIAKVIVDGNLDMQHDLIIDAVDDYQTIKLADGVVAFDIEAYDSVDEAMKALLEGIDIAHAEAQVDDSADEDDEDAVAESSGNGGDEEE